MTIASTDYHDYVFRDGVCVGDFEGMYRHSADVPWHQDRTAYEVGADIDIAIMRTRQYASICDVGCGLGYFTHRMSQELRTPTGDLPMVTGVDVAPTALATASARYPHIAFAESDVAHAEWVKPGERFDLIVARDLLWYVCADLDRVVDRLVSLAWPRQSSRYLHITQSFPGGARWVGQDVISSPDHLLSRFERVAGVLHWCLEYDPRWSDAKVLHVFGEIR